MASVSTGVGPLDGHLKSKDFFDAAANPSTTFVADKFVFDGDKVTEVVGALTMMGKSNPVTLKASNFNCYQSPMLGARSAAATSRPPSRAASGAWPTACRASPTTSACWIQIEAIKQ